LPLACAVALVTLSALPAQVDAQSASSGGNFSTQTREMSDARASSTALEQARRLREDGDTAGALRTIEMALERLPRDVALRFTRAVMQADLGQTDAAVAGFTALTQEYPELPEPHNNLATLHAARGDLDRRLAARAWERATQFDKASEASTKLKLARDLIVKIAPAAPSSAPARAPSAAPGR
jgi:predicted Zn-dependent protease